MSTERWVRDDKLVPEDIQAEWDQWLKEHLDAGNYDAYKDRSTQPPTWHTDTYMPPHLVAKMEERGL